MTYEGVLTKMQTEFSNPIQYYLVFENSFSLPLRARQPASDR